MLPSTAKPYLIRAIYEWCLEQNHTPHLLVAADYPGVHVPAGYAKDGKITLNIAPRATHGLVMSNDWISFMARFGGKPMKLEIPTAAVVAIYAMETQEGLVFGEPENPATPPSPPAPETTPSTPGKRPGLRVVK